MDVIRSRQLIERVKFAAHIVVLARVFHSEDQCQIISAAQFASKSLSQNIMKKRSERRKHCVLAVVRRSQKFSPRRRPLPRGAGRPRFNQLEMVTTFTYKPSLVRIDARNFELP